MARPLRELPVRTALVSRLLRFASERGQSTERLAQPIGLTIDVADAGEVDVTPGALRALFDAVADACGEPSVGLRIASAPAGGDKYEPIELAVRASATVADAASCLARFAALMHPLAEADTIDGAGGLTWQRREPGGAAIGRHAVEYLLASVLVRCREAASDTALAATRVTFAHARPRDVAPLHRFFGTGDIVFGAHADSLVLSTEVARLPVATGDPRLLATAIELVAGALPAPLAASRAAALVRSKLPDLLAERPTLETVARSLAMSERTLQRRLKAEGTTFLDLQDEVREARARHLLRKTELPLLDVAESLGFADLATFSRAFKRWSGQPPGMFRRRSMG